MINPLTTSISADKIRQTSLVDRIAGESTLDFILRRRLEIRGWFVAGADFATIAEAYKISPREVKGIIVGGNADKRLASASIRATPEQINEEPITIEQALAEEPILIAKNTRVTPDLSFARAHQIYRWRRAGLPMAKIGERLGIGSERAAQIMLSHGFPRIFRHGWRSQFTNVSRKDGRNVETKRDNPGIPGGNSEMSGEPATDRREDDHRNGDDEVL